MESQKPKKKELSERQQKLLVALFGEADGNWREAMRIAGYSEMTSIHEALEPIKEEVLSQAQSYLASLSPRAVRKFSSLLDNPNQPGAPVLKGVAESILNRIGLHEKKAGDEINVKVPSGGLFILPAKEVQVFSRVIEIDHEDFPVNEPIQLEGSKI